MPNHSKETENPRQSLREFLTKKAEQALADWFGLRLITKIPETVSIGAAVLLREYHVLPKDTKNPVIVQMGAHMGFDTVNLAKRHPGASILAVEPNPQTAEILRKNVSGHDQITVLEVAVGNHDGEVTLNTNLDSPWEDSIIPSSKATKQINVKMVTASSLIPKHVDLLTCDVEGLEPNIIEDLSDSGAIDNIDHIVVELHGDKITPDQQKAIYDTLRKHGFKLTIGIGTRVLFIPKVVSFLDPFRKSLVLHAWKPSK